MKSRVAVVRSHGPHRAAKHSGKTLWRVEYFENNGMLRAVCGHRHKRKKEARRCQREGLTSRPS